MKEAHETARRGNVVTIVVQDIDVCSLPVYMTHPLLTRFLARQSLMGAVRDNLIRAERDNNLIYHKDIPSSAALPPITPASLVKSDIPSALKDPQSIVQGDVIFGGLLSWGAKTAIGETSAVVLSCDI